MSEAGKASYPPAPTGIDKHLPHLFDDLPVMLIATLRDGTTGRWNARACEWFGIAPGEPHAPLWDFIHPEDLAAVQAHWHDAVAVGEARSDTFRARSASGEYRWLSASAAPFRHHDTIGWTCALTDINDYRLAKNALETALQRSDARTRLLDGLMEHLPMGVVIANAPDGTVRRVSRHSLELAGASEDDVVGVPFDRHPATFHLFHRDGTPARPEELPLARAIREGEIISDEEWLHIGASGRKATLLCSAAPIRDHRGEIVAGVSACFDITRRKLEQEQLHDTSQRMKSMIGNSPLAVIEWDPDHHITGWMGHAESMFGWKAAEVLGKRVDEFRFVYPEDWGVVQRAMISMQQGLSGAVSNRNYRKDGTVIHCEWYNSVVVDRDGRLLSGLSLVLDVTIRHRIEEALRVSEEKYRSIFESAPIGVFQSTRSGRVTRANSRMAAMFRYESPEEMTRLVNDIGVELYVDAADRREVLCHLSRTGSFAQRETTFRRKDGSTFSGNLYIRTFTDEHGGSVLEGFIEDITKRKRAEDALREAYDVLERRVEERTAELSAANERLTELDRLKSQFLASMSHELRTPLNSIIGFTSLLQRGLTGPVNDEQSRQLGIVRGSAAHLLALINDLLDVSRIEAGRADLQYEPFDFTSVIGEAVASLKPMADRKGIDIAVHLGQSQIPMLGDRKRSLQVLLNLMSNALKFTDKGRIEIGAAVEAGTLRVEVADTGIGIRTEHLAMLFEAFRQVDGSAKRVYEGTGLGLYLCRKLLDLMGGEIDVKSEYGKGSRFTYTVPMDLRPEAAR